MRPLSLCLSCRLSLILRPNGRPEGSSMVTTMASGSSSNVSQESRSSLKRLNFLGRFWFRPKMGALKVVSNKYEDLSEVVVVPFLDTETTHSTFSVGNLEMAFLKASFPIRIPAFLQRVGHDVEYPSEDVMSNTTTTHQALTLLCCSRFHSALCQRNSPLRSTYHDLGARFGWSPFRACSCSLMIWIRNSIEQVKVGMLYPPQKKSHPKTQKPPVTKTIRLSVSQVRCDRTKLSHLG